MSLGGQLWTSEAPGAGEGGGTNGQMDERTNGRTGIPSVFYRISSPSGSLPCFLSTSTNKLKQGKGTDDHILSVDHWFLLFCLLLIFWAAAPKGTKSCRTHEEFLSVRLFVRSFVPSPLGLPKSKSGL